MQCTNATAHRLRHCIAIAEGACSGVLREADGSCQAFVTFVEISRSSSSMDVPGVVLRVMVPRGKEVPGRHTISAIQIRKQMTFPTCVSPTHLLDAIENVKRGGIPSGYSCLTILIHDQGKPSLMPVPPKSNIMM